MNNTDSLNLENARLMTILNAGRQKLDALKHTIGYKSKLINQFDRYPDEYIENVSKIVRNMDNVIIYGRAEEELKEVMNELEKRDLEREEKIKLERKEEFDVANKKMLIQAELAKKRAEKEQKCIEKLYKILEELDAALK